MIPTPASSRRSAPRRPVGAPGLAPAATTSVGSVVPFDHAARFALTGRTGNLIQDVINIGADGIFVAVGIGYGLQEERGVPQAVSGIAVNASVNPGDIRLDQIPPATLIE